MAADIELVSGKEASLVVGNSSICKNKKKISNSGLRQLLIGTASGQQFITLPRGERESTPVFVGVS